MDCQIVEENFLCLAEYSKVPISFQVDLDFGSHFN